MMFDRLIDSPGWQAAGWTMIHFLWIGMFLGLVTGLGRLLLRGSRPQVRYLFLFLSLLLMGVAPWPILGYLLEQSTPDLMPENVAVVSGLEHTLPMAATLPEGVSPEALSLPGRDATTAHSSMVASIVESPQGRWKSRLEKVATIAPWIWLIGSPLTLIFMCCGFAGVERLRRNSSLVSDEWVLELSTRLRRSLNIGRDVLIAVNERVASPILIGVIKPMILLPPALVAGCTPEQMEMILLHELAHVRRWDPVMSLVQRIIECLLFFHPMVWMVSRWLRAEREHCCDDIVLRYAGSPDAYAETLVALAAPQGRSIRVASLAFAQHPLVHRIRRILGFEDHSLRLSPLLFASISLVFLMGLAVAIAAIPGEDGSATDDSLVAPRVLRLPLDRIVGSTSIRPEGKPLGVGNKAPDFEMVTLDGRVVSLEDFQGKVTCTVFWATWCGPCKPLLNRLGELYNRYHEAGFEVITFSLDDNLDVLASHLKKSKYPWQHNIHLGSVEHPIARAYGVSSLPTIYVIGTDGKVYASKLILEPQEGRHDRPKPDDIIRSLLPSDKTSKKSPPNWAVQGIVNLNGELPEISIKFVQVAGANIGKEYRPTSFGKGCFAYHGLDPGSYELRLGVGGMSSKVAKLSISKRINVLEDAQWHNFELKDGSSRITCPVNDSFTMFVRRRDPNHQAYLTYSQYKLIRSPDDLIGKQRKEYSFAGLHPGDYEYRRLWYRGSGISEVHVATGQISLKANETVVVEPKLPTGLCSISGSIQGAQTDGSGPVVFIRKAPAYETVYGEYYEMGTWDTLVLLRGREIKTKGTFECRGLPAGEYVVTIAQMQDRQYGVAKLQESKSVQLSEQNPAIHLDFDLKSNSSK